MNFKTSKNSLSFLMWTFFIYLTAPFFEWVNLTRDLASGKFPVNADSIGLPFGIYIIVWSFFLPFVLGFSLWIGQKSPMEVSLFAYNSERPFWSFLWTVTFGYLAFGSLVSAFANFQENHLIGVMYPLLLVYFFMLLRANIVFRQKKVM